MYPLGKQFEVDYSKAKNDNKAMVVGRKYRITVITERVVRLEYSPTGTFVDIPSQLVKNRNFGLPEFTIRQDNNFLEIPETVLPVLVDIELLNTQYKGYAGKLLHLAGKSTILPALHQKLLWHEIGLIFPFQV